MAVPNYKPIINAHAYQQLNKGADIPDLRLMVGSAECLEPLPLLIYKNAGAQHKQKLVQKAEKDMAYEEAVEKFEGLTLRQSDFQSEGLYLGEPVGEV